MLPITYHGARLQPSRSLIPGFVPQPCNRHFFAIAVREVVSCSPSDVSHRWMGETGGETRGPLTKNRAR
jgi:hypothetical protein